MKEPYHDGELAVQERAGTRALARKIGMGIHADIPPVAGPFLRRQRLAIVGVIDPAGHVAASVLAGEPGFVEALDARTVRLAAAPLPSDPLAAVLPGPVPAGLLVIDLTTRRRLRLNGSLERHADGTLVLRTAEVFWNCPKYIQQRVPDAAVSGTREPIAPGGGAALGAAQQRWIARADTFFITTAHAERGVDASHRGGRPGFVQVVDAHTLVWPEYAGNGMFQTLGNLAVDPRCGLLLVDFVTGVTLQLSGRARIVWDEERAARVAGAERLVELRIDRVREAPGPDALRWRLLGPSPFNPP